MNTVCFDYRKMRSIYDDCIKTQSKLGESVSGLSNLSNCLETEISAFNGEGDKTISQIAGKIHSVTLLINEVESKKSSAISKKQKELPPPTKPSIPAKATAEEGSAIINAYYENLRQVEVKNANIRKENARLDGYVSKCNTTISNLKDILIRLKQIQIQAKNELSCAISNANEQLVGVKESCKSFTSLEKNMQLFNHAFESTLDDADTLVSLRPASIKSDYYINRLDIKNRHGRTASASSSDSTRVLFADFSEEERAENPDAPITPLTNEEVLIKERQQTAFLNEIAGLNKIKMPGANLHKLGGKAFLSKMQDMGWMLQYSSSGSIISDDGMIHWEKKNG